MSDYALQQDNLFHQLTLNSALTDALTILYNTNHKSDNKYINKFLQLYKPICQKINETKVTKKNFDLILNKPFAKGAFGKMTIVKSAADDSIYAMKIIKKSYLINQMDRATPMEERLILSHPNEEWLPNLHASFQDDKNLYLVMEYTPGGDLSFLIDRKQVLFTEEVARFYIAELILAIERVHQLGYMHRDIKPENILIDKSGHIKLGDLGSCIAIDTEEPLSMVGTGFYMSPQMHSSLGNTRRNYAIYGKEVDWWSVGVVLYELLVISNTANVVDTDNPLNTTGLKNSLENDPKTALSYEAKDLILRLLSTEKDRLGYNGVEEIKAHPFFKNINWKTIHTEEKPPFIPEIKSVDDTTYFSGFHEDESEYDDDDSDSEDDSDDDNVDTNKVDDKTRWIHEFPFIGYTCTDNFIKKPDFIKQHLPEKNELNTEMKERIEILEQENKQLLKVNQQQHNSLTELYPLKAQINQLQSECQTLREEKSSLHNNLETNSIDLERIRFQLKKEKEDTKTKEQQWFKQLAALKNDLKDKRHQNEGFLHLENENHSLLEQLKESQSKIDALQNELEENKRQFNRLQDSRLKEQKPNVKSAVEEKADRSLILTAMWERDQQLVRSLQTELNLSENKLSKSKLQVLQLKKEIQHLQKTKLQRQKSKTVKPKKHTTTDSMEGTMKLSFESSSFRPFYIRLQNGALEILDEQNRSSKSTLDLRSMLSSATLSPEGILAIRTKEHSQSIQELQNQIKREKDIIASTQRTIVARSRLKRRKNDIDHELENTLKRATEKTSILERELEKSKHVIVPSSDKSQSCCRCLTENQSVYKCQNCQYSFHSECVSSAPNCKEYEELNETVPLLMKTSNPNDILKWYHAIKLLIFPENNTPHCK